MTVFTKIMGATSFTCECKKLPTMIRSTQYKGFTQYILVYNVLKCFLVTFGRITTWKLDGTERFTIHCEGHFFRNISLFLNTIYE